MKTYAIHEDNSYTGGLSATLTEFQGTWRSLLEELCGVTDENRDEVQPGEKMFPSEFTDDELRQLVEDGNGDGTNYTTVFEKQEDGTWKHVLG